MKDMLDGKEIVKELREVIDCIANEELKTATRMALTIIEKLQPKPLFVVGPAKYQDGTDCNILAIHPDDARGMVTEYKRDDTWLSRWHFLNGTYFGNAYNYKNVLPNAPEEKVYGPQKCNETVKTCENCNCETVTCFACHNFSEWEPFLTDGKLWDKIKAVEKAHRGTKEVE